MNHSKSSDWRPLALMLTALIAVYAIAYRFLPFDVKAYALWPFGAWALYAGARLTFRVSVPMVLITFGVTDLILYATNHYPPNTVFYLCLLVSLVLGKLLLSRSQSLLRIGGGAIAGYGVFFLVSNFAAWLEPARPYYQPHTFATLMLAFEEGLAFLRMQPGQLVGDILLSFGLFRAHAYLARTLYPSERVTESDHEIRGDYRVPAGFDGR